MVAVKIPGVESIDHVSAATVHDPGVQSSPEDFGAGIGASQQRFGDTMAQTGATLVALTEHLRAKRQAAEDDGYVQKYNVDVAQRIEAGEYATRKAYPDGGPDYVAASQASRLGAHEGTINDLAARGITPSDKARLRVAANYAGRDMNGGVGAVTYDNNAQVEKLKSLATENATATASQVQAGTLSLDDGIKQVDEVVKSATGIYSGKELRLFEDTAKKTVVDGEIERLTRAGLTEQATQLRDKWYGKTFAKGEGNAGAVATAAANLGVNPRDLAAVISYETGGKMDPSQWGGKGNNYLGLIQFGPEERAKYGVRPGMTFAEQMPAVEAYLRDRGLKPGMDVAQMYSIINTGSLMANGQPAWAKSDGNGTVADHVVRIQKEHFAAADKFLAGTQGTGDSAAILPDPAKSLQWQKQFEAQRTDMVRADALKKIQDKNNSDAAENETQKALEAARVSGKEDEKYTMRTIGNDDRMDLAAKARMKILAERVYKEEPLAKVSHQTTIELLNDIRRPDGDPKKMTTVDPIFAAFGADKLKQSDFEFLQKQFTQNTGPDGSNLVKQKNAFVKNAGDAITIANIGSSMTGGGGTFQKYNFERHVDKLEQDYRTEGKNPANLFNPGHADYLGRLDSNGRPFILKNFVVDQQQAARDEAAGIKTPTIPDNPANRLKLDEWLRQRGGFNLPAAVPAAPAPPTVVSQ